MNIDTSLVRKLVNSQFPQWSSLPIRPVSRSGWDNRTFRLGNRLSVRLPSAECYASQVHKEQQWLSYLGERITTSIPRTRALGKPGHGYPWSWSVYEWIDGEDVTAESVTDTIGLAESLAFFITELHLSLIHI